MIITIDGPSASGKSVIASRLANKLKYYYINSGMLYRALAYIFLKECNYSIEQLKNVNYEDAKELFNHDLVDYIYFPYRKPQIFFSSKDISSLLKTAEIDQGASIIGENRDVRKTLLEYQRLLATKHSVVTDGRDMGTVVYPNADIKFFLTASIEARAKRWKMSQERRDNIYSLEQAVEAIKERDLRDSSRDVAPLKPSENAILVDNSDMNTFETFRFIFSKVKTKMD